MQVDMSELSLLFKHGVETVNITRIFTVSFREAEFRQTKSIGYIPKNVIS